MKKFFFVIFFLKFLTLNSYSEIVYVDINIILNKSNIGKSLNTYLIKIKEEKSKGYKIIEDNLIKKEKSLIAQQNIITKEEFEKQLNSLSQEVNQYRSNKKKLQNEINQIKIENTKKILKILNPIITKYVEENSISLVMPKKNIVVGKKNLDITNKIIKILNDQSLKLDFWMKNIFFIKNDKVYINNILNVLKLKKLKKNYKINDIKELDFADKNDITFFHSKKYIESLKKTKSKLVITNSKFTEIIPNNIKIIEVKNVLLSVGLVTSLFYPSALDDSFDKDVIPINKSKFNKINTGQNVLIGKNVKIGKNCSIGHNSIIERNVVIGENCQIGSNVIIKNTIIGKNSNILDGAVLGKKGFGFFPGKVNTRYPHIGAVIIGDNVEIGSNNTIDRGSLSNTIIGDGTFLDNQVHIAHNVKIGKNCIITGQVGFAGSSTIGDRVMIGGQAGISGHLTIGDNVQIGGGSGVINNIPSNNKVMGYPARNIRNFLRDNKIND